MTSNPDDIINVAPYLLSAPGTLIYSTDPGVEYTKIDSEGNSSHLALRITQCLEAGTGSSTGNIISIYPTSSAEGSVEWADEVNGMAAFMKEHSEAAKKATATAAGCLNTGDHMGANSVMRKLYASLLGQEAILSERAEQPNRVTVELGDPANAYREYEMRPCSVLTEDNTWEANWIMGRALGGARVTPDEAPSALRDYLQSLNPDTQNPQLASHIENTGSNQMWKQLTTQLEERYAMLGLTTVGSSTARTPGLDVGRKGKGKTESAKSTMWSRLLGKK